MTVGISVASSIAGCMLIANLIFFAFNLRRKKALSWWARELESSQQEVIKTATNTQALAKSTRELADKDMELATVLLNGVRNSDFNFATVKQYYN